MLVSKNNPRVDEMNEYPLAAVQTAALSVTHSVLEIPTPREQSPPPEVNSEAIRVD